MVDLCVISVNIVSVFQLTPTCTIGPGKGKPVGGYLRRTWMRLFMKMNWEAFANIIITRRVHYLQLDGWLFLVLCPKMKEFKTSECLFNHFYGIFCCCLKHFFVASSCAHKIRFPNVYQTNLVARNQLIGSSFTSARSARGVICPIVGDLRWGHGKKSRTHPLHNARNVLFNNTQHICNTKGSDRGEKIWLNT